MKTITIRLPDVEAAMLLEVQKVNKDFRNLVYIYQPRQALNTQDSIAHS